MRGSRKPVDPTDEPGCYASAVKMLEIRWHGRDELRRKLRVKGYQEATVDAVITRLTAEGWLDDARFAAARARALARKGQGPHRVLRDLAAAGVDDSAARQAVERAAEDLEGAGSLESIARKKMKALSRSPDIDWSGRSTERDKLTAALYRRGFDLDEIHEVIARLAAEVKSTKE